MTRPRSLAQRSSEARMLDAQQRILAYIDQSEVPEDPAHARNTLAWVLRLWPEADPALRLAALAHDIDRASKDKVCRDDYGDYDSFKAAHARHGAQLLRALLEDCKLDPAAIEEACRLVRLHETGGDLRANLLRDADSLSYFEVNLPLYYQREGEHETLRRCAWGVQRLSADALRLLQQFEFADPEIHRLVQRVLDP